MFPGRQRARVCGPVDAVSHHHSSQATTLMTGFNAEEAKVPVRLGFGLRDRWRDETEHAVERLDRNLVREVVEARLGSRSGVSTVSPGRIHDATAVHPARWST